MLSCAVFDYMHIPCRIFLLLIFIINQQAPKASAQGVLDTPVSFSCKNCGVIKALINLGDSANIEISISDHLLTPLPNITIGLVNTPLKEVIKKITQGVNAQPTVTKRGISISVEPLRYILNGHLKDVGTKEGLPGAKVGFFVQGIFQGYFVTNDYGYFSLKLPPGTYQLTFSYPGFGTYVKDIVLDRDISGDILVSPNTNLKEIIVTDSLLLNTRKYFSSDGKTVLIGALPEPISAKMPGSDLANSIAQMPGVNTGVDGLGGMQIRGGNTDQNMFLLDDVPVYNPNHGLGLLSIFNSGIIKSANIWKGDFPSRYGGRASSVVDIRTRDGNMNNLSGGLSFNAFSASAFLEGPLIKEKSSFLISARRSFFAPLIRLASVKNNVLNADFRNLGYLFYDIHAKINYQIGPKDRIFMSYYKGQDAFKAPITQRTDAEAAGIYFDSINLVSQWGNTILALRWNHLRNEQQFSNTTLSYSTFHYNSQLGLTTDNITPDGRQTRISNYIQIYNTDIRDWAVRHDFTWFKDNNLEFRSGFNGIIHRSNPGALSLNYQIPGQTENIIDSFENGLRNNSPLIAYELEGYCGMDMTFWKHFHAAAGANTSLFFINSSTYRSFLPKLRINYNPFNSGLNFWTSYNYMAQYMHQIGSFNIGLPFELWVPSTAKVKPERVRQFSAGGSWTNEHWFFRSEFYSKKLNRVLVLLSVSESIIEGMAEDANGWEDRVIAGTGNSKGLELIAERKMRRVNGKISYTLSKTDRQFADLNNGQPFPFQFDRRHSIKGSATGKIFNWWSISIGCNYISGNPITLAGVKYNHQAPDPDFPQKPRVVYVYSSINGYRLPWIKSWDIAFNFNPVSHFFEIKQKHRIQLGVSNIFNRKNPFYQVFNENSSKTQNAVQYTLLPVMPFINYEMTF